MPSEQTHKCAHPPCTCIVDEHHEYCSPACQLAATSGQLDQLVACACPHQGCAAPR